MPHYLNFDHAAATTVRPEAWASLRDLESIGVANPSSVHGLGRKSRGVIDAARINLAEQMLVKPEELMFTSGATEALVTVIVGGYAALEKRKLARRGGGVVYTSPLVHSCVWAGLDYLQAQYDVEIKYVPITESGHLNLEAIDDTLMAAADMIITEHLNSEIGVLQPVAKLGKKLIRWADEQAQPKPLFIVDAAASAVSERVGLDFQKCDFLALSAEKVGGFSGTGVLLKRDAIRLEPLIGGSQEWGWRGGTENLMGIAAFAAAYNAHIRALEAQNKNSKTIKNKVTEFFKTQHSNYKIITPEEGSGNYILTVLSPETPASLLVVQADLQDIAISAGSACSSGSVEGSRVLEGLGLSPEASQRGLRISWGWDTTEDDLENFLKRLSAIL